MAAAAVLRPSTSQVEFTARPALRPSKNPVPMDGKSPAGTSKIKLLSVTTIYFILNIDIDANFQCT